MNLTSAQLVTLGNDIRGNAAVAQELADGNNNGIAAWYNQDASPDFWVLLDQLPVDDAIEAMDWAADYSTFKDDMTAFLLLFRNGTYGVRGPGARGALNSVLSGAGSSKANILAAATRLATYAEQLFATAASGPGGGSGGSQASAANTNATGPLTSANVRDALAATA